MKHLTTNNRVWALLALGSAGVLGGALLSGCGGGAAMAGPIVPNPTNQEKILFVSRRSNPEGTLGGIWITNPDGSETKFLASGGSPSWSPNHTKIAFAAAGESASNAEIYIMDANGQNKRRLTQNVDNDFSPSWSPDGRRIVFVSERDERPNYFQDLYIVNVDNLQIERVTETLDSSVSHPAWSPDGSRIVFQTQPDVPRPPTPALYLVNSDGSGKSLVTSNGGEPDWQPNNQAILFRKFEAASGLYTITPTGANETSIAAGYSAPSYSPDGRKIVCVGVAPDNPINSELFLLNADGSNLVRLTNNEAQDLAPDWR